MKIGVLTGGGDCPGLNAVIRAVVRKADAFASRVVGVPKTIDNDLSGTDFTFGFDTAVSIATDAIDRIHTTAESHNRVMVVEVMGGHAGWIATYAGIAGGASVVLIPEKPIDIDEVCDLILRRHSRGKNFSIVVVAEGAKFREKAGVEGELVTQEARTDEFGHVRLGGISQLLAAAIEKRTKFETRFVVLGHIQRGGSPTAHDRVLATRYGIHATEMVHRGEFGKMAALQGNRIVAVPLAEATAKEKTVDMIVYSIAEEFFG